MTLHYDWIRLFMYVCVCWKNQPNLRPQKRLSALLAIVNTERKNYMTKLRVTVEDERGRQSGKNNPQKLILKIMLTIMDRAELVAVVDWRGGGERSNKEDRIMIPTRRVNVANLLFWDCILSMNESNIYENLSCVSCHILPLPLTPSLPPLSFVPIRQFDRKKDEKIDLKHAHFLVLTFESIQNYVQDHNAIIFSDLI